jgi:sugar lactone lactonase YvrE
MRNHYLSRSRWAAIGAAVAVTLGAGGLISVNAANDTSSFVPITPTRILDTRSGDRVGSLDTAGVSDPYRLKVIGTAGIPLSGVTAVSLNVTAVDTRTNNYGGFVSVYPCASMSSTKPDVSNINFVSGQTVANAVTVAVSADGYVCFYLYGTAHVVVDANGYYSQASSSGESDSTDGGDSGSTDGSVCTNAAGVAGTVLSGADVAGLLLEYCVTSPIGTVTTLAGTAGPSGSADGTGADARFNTPNGVAVDGDGNVYVTDRQNHTVRKITPAGVVTTLAGTAGSSGSADGTGADARFNSPNGVAVDGGGNVYVADTYNHTVRKVTPAGVVTTLAGTATRWGSADGTGADARFRHPNGVAVDGEGNVYVADSSNHSIRKITSVGVVTTWAGGVTTNGFVDGSGPFARFNAPYGVAVDGGGNVYVADTYNYLIRKVTPAD